MRQRKMLKKAKDTAAVIIAITLLGNPTSIAIMASEEPALEADAGSNHADDSSDVIVQYSNNEQRYLGGNTQKIPHFMLFSNISY